MDILYVVGTGTAWVNNELRYSLRSIAKYGKNIDRVFIVGEKPQFVSNEVIHIPCEDIGDTKHKRIFNKIITAVNTGLLSDLFLLSSDDHFYVKPVDFNKLPVYYKKEEITITGTNEYQKSMAETKQFLLDNNLSIFQTNPHCNTYFSIPIYHKYKDLFDKGLYSKYGIETNCLMGNLLIKEGFKSKYYKDIKIGEFKNLLKEIGDTECFSIYDTAITCGIGDYFRKVFPKKCKYEK